jgi:hypothetical protein
MLFNFIALKALRILCSQRDHYPLNLKSKQSGIAQSSDFDGGNNCDNSRSRDREDPATSKLAGARNNRLYRLHHAQSSSQNSHLFA